MNSKLVIKPYSQLTLADFQRHPVWTWYESDDDERRVMAVDLADPLSYEEYGVAFILAEFTLNDGTELVGDISVRLKDKRVYALKFYQEGKSFMFGWALDPSGLLSQLSEWLDKPITAITPLQFKTPATFEDGEPIEGELELRDW